jgi:hypothetical protein
MHPIRRSLPLQTSPLQCSSTELDTELRQAHQASKLRRDAYNVLDFLPRAGLTIVPDVHLDGCSWVVADSSVSIASENVRF